jgi:hypothetical protein
MFSLHYMWKAILRVFVVRTSVYSRDVPEAVRVRMQHAAIVALLPRVYFLSHHGILSPQRRDEQLRSVCMALQ